MNPAPEDLNEDQNHLLNTSIERIEVAYLKAIKKGVEQPAVLLLNLKDSIAQEIVHMVGREASLEEMLSKADGLTYLPTCTLYVPTKAATRFLPRDHEVTISALQNWPTFAPPGTFPLILVGVGVISLFMFSIPEL